MKTFFDNGCHMAFVSGMLFLGVLNLTVGSYFRNRIKDFERTAEKEKG